MKVQTLINRIQAFTDEPFNYNLLFDKINIAISRLNCLTKRFDSFITIVNFSDSSWGNIETTWGDLTESPEELGRFSDWFTYNSDKYSLTPATGRILQVDKVYKDGLALRESSLEVVELEQQGTAIYTEDICAIVGRTIYFGSDIQSNSSVYKVRCKLGLMPVTSKEDDFNIPEYYDDLIYNLIMYDMGNEVQRNSALKFITAELESVGIKTDIWSTL